MSDSGKAIFPDFGKLVPGFDFLQNLTRQASGAASSGMPKMPNLGSWVAPTLNVEELDRRIEELKAVQFWLDQNATALKATIQALEVQKMTLSALQGMNVNMADMAKAFQMPHMPQMPEASGKSSGMASGMAAATDMVNTMASNMANMTGMASMSGKPAQGTSGSASRSDSPSDKPHHQFAGLEVPETSFMRREHEREQARSSDGAAPQGNGAVRDEDAKASEAAQQAGRDQAAEAVKVGAGMAAVIDPMQWWGALTQQFQTIANSALQDVSQRKPFETSQSLAQDALRTASKTASDFAESTSKSLIQSASNARDLMTGALHARGGGNSPSAGSRPRKASPARAGAMASDAKTSNGRKASVKTTKSSKGAATARSSKAEGKAQGKSSRATRSTTSSSSGRSAPQARGSTAGGTGSRGGKARSTTAARKASPRAR